MTTLEAEKTPSLSDTQIFRNEVSSFIELIAETYSPEHAELILGELSIADLKVINNTPGMGPQDYYAVARANTILAEEPELVSDFDKLKAKDLGHYARLQASWIMNDIYLLGIRTKRKLEPEDITKELKELEGRKEFLRYKLYYALRFPDRMTFPDPKLE